LAKVMQVIDILASATAAEAGGISAGDLPTGLLIFAGAGILMVAVIFQVGRLVRPRLAHPEKDAIYECGEPTIGTGWVQFDLRFYVVAVVFLVFDVEIALFYAWAVVFGGGGMEGGTPAELAQVKLAGLWDMLFFFGVIVVGFLYLWRYGYLDWVRSSAGQRRVERGVEQEPPADSGAAEGAA
jgi:NADH-quinone oxidoreductase subunit A